MRLTCPNCAAQYEVPEDVIPAEGRDVQCSSCGQTWFQASARALAEAPPEAPAAADTAEAEAHPEDSEAASQPEEAATEAEAAEDSPAEAQPAAKEPTPEQEPDTEPTPEPEVHADADPEPAEAAAEEPEEDDSPAEDSVAAPRARTLDPALSDILREEAERETALRTAERQSLETQAELGLQEPQQQQQDQDAAQRGREARDRMARLRGEDPRRLAAVESGSRRELLPDIEEINSTLRASGSPAAAATIAQPESDADSTPAPRRSGFARGFALSIFLGVLLVLAYDKSALITRTLPQAEPAVSSYVAWVDQARLWLDAQVQGLTAQ